MSRLASVAGAAVMVCNAVTGAAAQRVIAGQVADTGARPVAFARASIQGTTIATITDDDGHFRLRVPGDGRVTVRIQRLGFHPEERVVELDADSVTNLTFALLPLPTTLATVNTKANPTRHLDGVGFYGRMLDASKGLTRGTFITPEEIEERHPSSILHMLDGQPGVSVLRKTVMGQGGSCPMMVYVDGQIVEGADPLVGTARVMRDHILMRRSQEVRAFTSRVEEMAPPNAVAGIEIYPRAVSAPAEFQRLAGSCGIILIWTK